MRPLLLLLVVALCGAGCDSSQVTARDAPQPNVASTPTDTKGDLVVASSTATTQSRPAPNAAVTRRARSALARAGVTDQRSTPGYETEVNTAIEGTWRRRPVEVYVVPTAELPDDSGGGSTTEGHQPIGGRPVEVVRGHHSSILLLKFELDSDTWMLASIKHDRAGSDERRSVDLAAALLAQD